MAKPEGYATIGPLTMLKCIKDELQEICVKEADAVTGKKKTMEVKVTELVVENIKKFKPSFEVPKTNGGETCPDTPGT
jgi:hypothetical protein